MHPIFAQASDMTHDVIGAAIDVHRDKGPGLLESIYEWCLTMELHLRDYKVQRQAEVIIRYKQFSRQESLRCDLLINQCLLVEVKAVEEVHPINKAQLLSYMKLLDFPLGLIINFNVGKLTDGVSRLILSGASPSSVREASREISNRQLCLLRVLLFKSPKLSFPPGGPTKLFVTCQ